MRTLNSQYVPTPRDQGGINTCQSLALAVAAQTIVTRGGGPSEPVSPRYIFGEGQRLQGLFGTNIAPSTDNTIAAGKTRGICLEAHHPYTGVCDTEEPGEGVHIAAAQRKLSQCREIALDRYNYSANARAARTALASGEILIFGYGVRGWFENLPSDETQHLAIGNAAPQEPAMYGHCSAIVDFDDSFHGQGLAFKIANSRGAWWGAGGFAWVGPIFFRNAISLHAVRGFAGCSDRFTYDADGIPGQVYRLYRAAFNRVPDKGGLGFQIDALASGRGLQQLASDFLASPEGEATYPPGTTNAQFVDRLYDNVLHRPGDPQGRANHLADLVTGTPRRDKLLHFSESPENKTACAPAFERGVAYT